MSMSTNLTDKQKRILDFIKSTTKERGYPPSIREIGDAVGLSSTSTVHGYLKRLEEKGVIRRDPTKPRALEIIEQADGYSTLEDTASKEMINVPVVGRVAAGQPILAQENVEDYFPLPLEFVQHGQAFMLKVKGDSMCEAGILNNDYIVVRKQDVAQNGDIVVALIDDEATVKRFYKEKDCIRLQPENKYMEPIIVKDVKILGKVIAVLRKL